jgi:hypothetical protein
MPRVGFETTIPVFERVKRVHHALDRAATVICWLNLYVILKCTSQAWIMNV